MPAYPCCVLGSSMSVYRPAACLQSGLFYSSLVSSDYRSRDASRRISAGISVTGRWSGAWPLPAYPRLATRGGRGCLETHCEASGGLLYFVLVSSDYRLGEDHTHLCADFGSHMTVRGDAGDTCSHGRLSATCLVAPRSLPISKLYFPNPHTFYHK